MKITLKDGAVREFEGPVTVLDAAKAISEGLARRLCAAEVDGRVVDLRTELNSDCTVTFLTFEDEDGRGAFRHTASHIMAQAVKRLYPEVKLAIGPSIADGFYYDFDRDQPFTPEELDSIEKEMKKIVKENLSLERFTLPRKEAIALMEEKGEPYKVELIRDLEESAVISFYRQGEYVDLCAGPHLVSTGAVKAFKLTSVAGAYWRGDEKNKMLTRIYGTAFTKAADLEEYLTRLEEAKKRDHRKLGKELGLFALMEEGPGFPFFLPKGMVLKNTLIDYWRQIHTREGYVEISTPMMLTRSLWETSGHWDHYQDGMFVLGDEEKDDEVLALRPMTCPFQYTVYNAEHHSYKDLPIRYGETSTLFRNEASGEMHGLIRVRQFTLSEGHIICTPGQLEDEFMGVLDLIKYNMGVLGIEKDVTYRFSKWDPNNKEKYVGDEAEWERVQDAMRQILDHTGLKYYEADGEAAFYGPKLDIQFKNVFGKEDTLFTVQIDFSLAERFQMTYVDRDGQKKTPYIIHRSSIGCYERTLAMLIEKYAGALPMWMMSEEVRLMNITEAAAAYCHEYAQRLRAAGLRVTVDDRQEKIGYKIREARNERIPYMLVAGEKEITGGTFAVRRRGEGEIGSMTQDDFLEMAVRQDREKTIF